MMKEIIYTNKATSKESEIQKTACNAYEELMDSLQQFRSEEKKYPSNYGGTYINSAGKLVINITDNNPIPVTLNSTEDVIYEKCQFSYNELNEIMNKLNKYKLSEKDEFKNEFNFYYLSCLQNKVVVHLNHLTKENVLLFKQKVFNSAAIQFEQVIGDSMDDASLNPGGSLGKEGGAGLIGSIGYRVKRNGQEGFITAGHVASQGSDLTYENGYGAVIGKCEISVYSGSVDAAYVKSTNNAYSLTNTINGTSNVLSTAISEPGEGTMINKCGAVTNITSGKIVSTNATYSSGNITFTNLVSAEYSAESGDSGGVVYSYVSSTGVRYTLGIHKGRQEVTMGNEKKVLSFYVKANLINSTLGTSRY